ncbi:ribosomal protein S18-alanine N-acetyltransferase [Schaalia canis]|nr:ribosomal protein S18-alanine N-acetyltransferase [Schaalia canis]
MSTVPNANGGLVVELRPMTAADVPTVCALEQAIFPEDPWTPGMVDEELRAAGRHYVAAYANTDGASGEIVGYAGITLGPDADVMTIGVLPQWRGKGVGARLLADLLSAAEAAGSERIFLEVRASNEAAQGLYRRYGFEIIGRIRNYFRHPLEDAVTMLRERADNTSVH